MNIIIDSDLFWASKTNRSCYDALQTIRDIYADKANEFNLIVDDNLLRAYNDFLDTYVGAEKTAKIGTNRLLRFTVYFMAELLNQRKRMVNVNKNEVNISIGLQEIFSKYDILSDEQCLLVIADSMQQIQSKNIILLLTDPPTETLLPDSPDIVSRQLYKGKLPSLIHDLRKVIPELVIVYSSDENILSSQTKRKNLPNEKQSDYIFELFSAIWMSRTYGCIPGPQRRKIRGEEIDGWCYKVDDQLVTEVYISESKHRSNLSKGVDYDVINQLADKIEAVKGFDWAELNLEKSPDIQYFGLIISNSVEIEEEISENIRALSERFYIDIIVVKVRLPRDWMTNDQAKLLDANFEIHDEYKYQS